MRFLQKHPHLTLTLLSLLFFVPFLGAGHLFDWDEINFAESAREMVVSGNWHQVRIGFVPFWEKPPFFFWLQAISMHLFGINEFAARLPNALCGVVTLNVLFTLGKRFASGDDRWGWTWALLWFGSLLPHFYFHSGIIDPWFNLFMFLAVWCLSEHTFLLADSASRVAAPRKPLRAWVRWAGVFTGMAVLTKGPAAVVLVGLAWALVWFIQRKEWRLAFPLKDGLEWGFLAFLTSTPWYLYDIFTHGPKLIVDFFEYQIRLARTEDAGHGGPIWFYIPVLLVGCFPASVLFLEGLRNRPWADQKTGTLHRLVFARFQIVLFFVVLVVFSLVRTKIVHYSSLTYFPLTWIAADFLMKLNARRSHVSVGFHLSLALIALVLVLAPLAVGWVGTHSTEILQKVSDKPELAAIVRDAQVTWEWGPLVGLSAVMAAGALGGLYLWFRSTPGRGVLVLGFAVAIYLTGALAHMAPKAERYSQGPVIDFYKEVKGKGCWADVFGHKSYAQYFYGELPPPPAFLSAFDTYKWHLLKDENPEQTLVMVVKSRDKDEYIKEDNVHLLGEKGMFAFLARIPPQGDTAPSCLEALEPFFGKEKGSLSSLPPNPEPPSKPLPAGETPQPVIQRTAPPQ